MSRNRAIIVQTPTKINKEVQCYPTNNFYTHVSFDLQQFSILPFSLSLSRPSFPCVFSERFAPLISRERREGDCCLIYFESPIERRTCGRVSGKKSSRYRRELARTITEDLVKQAKEVICGLPKNAPRLFV